MLTVEEAQEKILSLQKQNSVSDIPLEEALHHVLAEEIKAPFDLPPFSSSAMDGYALFGADIKLTSKDRPITLKIVDDLWAGKPPLKKIGSGECARIMTGAVLPPGACAVVMQEDVRLFDGMIMVQKPVRDGENVRFQGEELKTGNLALKKGHLINSATLGLLANLGITKIPVVQKPKVTIIVTGSELVSPGTPLERGQIYESNSVALQAALREIFVESRVIGPLRDEQNLIFDAVSSALQTSTHLIVCGGVSVGDYDLNKKILADCQVTPHFWKVAQKPGKPLFFGTRGDTLVFGVPGNPASSLVCFHNYIRPALLKSMGCPTKTFFLQEEAAFLTHDLSLTKSDKIHFERAYAFFENKKLSVTLMTAQGSHMMKAFAEANCLVKVKSGQGLKTGDPVTIQWLPGCCREGGVG